MRIKCTCNAYQTIAAATGTLTQGVRYCWVDYTTTNPVTDIEWTNASTSIRQVTTFIDVDGNAGTNNITIKNTADTVIGTIVEDYGAITLASDGTNVYVAG